MIKTHYDPRRDTLEVYADDAAIETIEQITDESTSYAIGKDRMGDVYFVTVFDASALQYSNWRMSSARAATPLWICRVIDAWCARPTLRAGLDVGVS